LEAHTLVAVGDTAKDRSNKKVPITAKINTKMTGDLSFINILLNQLFPLVFVEGVLGAVAILEYGL
jgi:hypothetical protein